MRSKCRLGVLVSGNGSNLQAILDACQEDSYPAEVRIVVSNQPKAFALQRAQKRGIPTVVVPHRDYPSRELFEKEIASRLEAAQVELVVLAGFMRLLSPFFVRRFADRIFNIHPALLPSFPGTDAIRKAWDSGVKTTGVTVHFVDEGCDTGPIVLQEPVTIDPGETLQTLEEKIHKVEHRLYPEAIRLFALGKLKEAR